ncbi:MAG: hypothetical protein ABSE82_01940 [Nitrososphaerales archaeon]
MQFEKGFNPTLFDCIDVALTSVLGRESVSTFYYAITANFKLQSMEFERKPLKVIQYLRLIIGEPAFALLEGAVLSHIKRRFQITGLKDEPSLKTMVELAKNAYLHSEL